MKLISGDRSKIFSVTELSSLSLLWSAQSRQFCVVLQEL